jgi:hypothetical protein
MLAEEAGVEADGFGELRSAMTSSIERSRCSPRGGLAMEL